MRGIRFRAWIKPVQIFANRQYGYMIDVSVINFEEKWVSDDEGTVYDFHEIELMQYTELKDKKGVEIYEGDVLFHPLQGRRKVYYPYREGVASYGLRDIDNGFGSTLQDSHAVWEVIGNIWENQELLGIGEL